jgi:hypothetical protein
VVQVIVAEVVVTLLEVTALITGIVTAGGVEKVKLGDVAVPAESVEIAI